ncbi:MAG: adenylosuccinate synthase [Spirochaetales bacterium]|nr:adenylosuccinate synthase [Spirochaetales bacterium]
MHLVVIGAQWGDEGKGKIVDYLSEEADLVVRFSGGANAGHTIVTDDITYKLHLIPSGIVYPKTKVVLGTGMVIDPESLFSELATIKKQGISWKNRVFISDRAHIVMPSYKTMDVELEKGRRSPIGTTGRGIGVTYSQKAQREGIRICDLGDESFLGTLTTEELDFLKPFIDPIKEMMIDLASFIDNYRNKKVLFEGAQGILLDLDIGTYPFVSSGYAAAAGASLGGGIGPGTIDKVFGVFKAYSTRVGNGPFPSEFSKERDGTLEQYIRDLGREYGVTTGRPRRCGYLDLVALKYACRTNSINHLVLTHIDVYDDMDEIKVCVAYEADGKEISDFPSSRNLLAKVKPVLRSFKGWKEIISEIKDYNSLPVNAKDYIKFIEDYTNTSIGIVSVGYKREQTIMRTSVWTR